MSNITNTGTNNTGNWNSGNRNSGDRNSGDRNSGDRNSGNWNSGDRNSGNWNSGDRNSGNWNSGNWNSGNWNSGYGNSSDRQSGIFNSTETTIRMFNKETNLKWDDIDHPDFDDFYLNKWIPESDMTEAEKKADPNFFVREGYLKTFTWAEAWTNFWKDTSEENRQKFLNLPNFDSTVFKEITGIEVTTPAEAEGDVIELNGKKYKLVEEP
jgi:hypothetical protein